MVSTNQKLNKMSCKKQIASAIIMSLFAFFGIIVTEDYPMAIFYVIISLEIITWIVSLIVIIREKEERSVNIVALITCVDFILDFYLWWLIIVDGTVIEYIVMIVGILLGALGGYIYKEKQEDKNKGISKSLILFMSILGIGFARLLGPFLNQEGITIMGEVALDFLMMMLSFVIGAGIRRIRGLSS